MSLSSGEVRGGTQVRAEARTMEGSIFLSCSACFLILSRTVCPGVRVGGGGTGHRGPSPLISIINQEINPIDMPTGQYDGDKSPFPDVSRFLSS